MAVPYRCGVVVPPENPTVEDEMRALLGPVSLVTTRLPVVTGTLETRLSAYNDALVDAGAAFGGLSLDAIYLACTGSSYLVGPAGDGDLATRLVTAGSRPLTAAAAITATLGELSCRRIRVVSPYPDWLTERAVQFWRASGLEVTGVTQAPAPRGIYAITDADVIELLRGLDVSDTEAVLLSGTGMPTVTAITAIGSSLGLPVISSSVAAAHVIAGWSESPDCLAAELVAAWR